MSLVPNFVFRFLSYVLSTRTELSNRLGLKYTYVHHHQKLTMFKIELIFLSSYSSFYFPSVYPLYCHAFSYSSWSSEGKNTEVVCHSLLQRTMFYQNSPPWRIHLGWLYRAWLIVSLNKTRLWSVWSVWLVFYDCGFHSVCRLMNKVKRLMEASWWERLWGKLGLVLMARAMLSKCLWHRKDYNNKLVDT